MSVTKRVAKNFTWLILGGVIGGGLNFLAVVYLARVLGAENFGWTQFAVAILAYLILFVDSGLSMFGTREIAREKAGAGLISLNIYILRIILGVIIYAASFFIVILLPLDISLKMILIGTFAFLFSRAITPEWVFQGLEKMEYIALYKIFFALFYLLTLIFFVKSGSDVLSAVFLRSFWGIIASFIFMFIFYKWFVRIDFKNIIPSLWKKYFWLSLPLGASTIMVQIYTSIDTIMLGLIDKPAVVGYYNAAYQIYFACLGVFCVWISAAIPIMSRRMKEDKIGAARFVHKFSHITFLFVIPLATLTTLAAPLIISLVFSSAYSPAALALQLLIWNLITVAIGSICGVLILIAAGKYNEVFKATLFGAALNIVLNFILIPKYSFIGAAIATLIAEALVMLVSYYYSVKIIQLKIVRLLFQAIVFSLIGMTAYIIVLNWARLLSPVIRLASAGGAFLIAYLLILFFMERKFILGFAREVIGEAK